MVKNRKLENLKKSKKINASKENVLEKILCQRKQKLHFAQKTKVASTTNNANHIIRDGIIKRILDKAKIGLEESESEDDMPLSVRVANGRWRKQRTVVFPQIPRHKLTNFLTKFESRNTDRCKHVQHCVKIMNQHNIISNHWNSPLCLMRAINDSLISKKWNNLTQLSLLLLDHTDPKFHVHIRHVCEIMMKLNPLVVNSDIEGQLCTIKQVYSKSRRSLPTLT